MSQGQTFPDRFDSVYFSSKPWADRINRWLDQHADETFSSSNLDVIKQVLVDAETGVRMVVNITADALRSFLREGSYRNLYENPVIGGAAPKTVSDPRREVDEKLKIGPGTHFGAVALGGTGIRFYGEYCMVLKREAIEPRTRLLDRDSYDILNRPLSELPLDAAQIECLRGVWGDDAVDMAILRVLPQVDHDVRLVTSGSVSEAVLRDQEFIEVHLDSTFGPEQLEEVRHSPDDAATELSIAERERAGLFTTMVERMWIRQRNDVARDLDAKGVDQRVVTLHGRGYQWK